MCRGIAVAHGGTGGTAHPAPHPGRRRGVEAPSLSADGRYAVFTSLASHLVPGDTNGAPDVFLRDLRAGRTQRVSTDADGTPVQADTAARPLDARARMVAFSSAADNLAPGPRGPGTDAYVRRLGPIAR
ncbi:hypothetical protein WJ438_28280 [Streptomyces sp. GD-15H]|uniref:hypothetical protein n=1 Tax=Streptomyces sp. GD-15H TaxID=3129112 RepID=UPI0032528590